MSDVEYRVVVAEASSDYFVQIKDSTYDKVRNFFGLLSVNPMMGAIYEPAYEASVPPYPCRRIVVPTTNVELFYFVDDEHGMIVVVFACDARSDPKRKIWHSLFKLD